MAIERFYLKIPSQPFIENGKSNGIIKISDIHNFKVKMVVTIEADGLDPLNLEIKRILNKNEIVLGDIGKPIYSRRDMSAYILGLNPKISAVEQKRPEIPPVDYERAVYEEEPIVAKRVVPVDVFGDIYGKSHQGQQQIVEGSITGSVYNNLKLAYNATFQVEYISESPFATLDSENKHFIQKIEYDSVLNATRILLATSSFENPEITNITIGIPYTIDGNIFVNLIANDGVFRELEPIDSGGTGIGGVKTEEELTTITIKTTLGLNQNFSGKITEIISNKEIVIKIDNGTPIAETTNSTQGNIITKSNGENSSLLNRSWNLREGYVYRVREDE